MYGCRSTRLIIPQLSINLHAGLHVSTAQIHKEQGTIFARYRSERRAVETRHSQNSRGRARPCFKFAERSRLHIDSDCSYFCSCCCIAEIQFEVQEELLRG